MPDKFKPIDLACETCGAPPGSRCQWWSASSCRVVFSDDPHPIRVAAADFRNKLNKDVY